MLCMQQLLLINISKMKYDEGYNFLTEVMFFYVTLVEDSHSIINTVIKQSKCVDVQLLTI